MNNVTTFTSTTKTPSTPTADSSGSPLPQKWVAKVFERLSGQLGSKLADLYGGIPGDIVQAEWAQGLAGFSGEEIACGLAACQARIFAPTLGEFLHLCRPNLDGEVAWHEAQDGLAARRQGKAGTWSHPAVWRAAGVMREQLLHGHFKGHRNRWEHVLRTEFAKGFGEGVPAVPVAAIVENHKFTPMPDYIRQHLASIGILLNRAA